MFPGAAAAAGAAEAVAEQVAVVADPDVGGIAGTPPPTNPWANPVSLLQRPAAPAETGAKHLTRADQAIAYLRTHGPAGNGDLCKALGITSKGGVTPFISSAIKDGRIVRVNGKYAVGGEAPAAAPSPAPTPAPESVAEKARPAAISHFEAATAIVAMRKPRVPRAAAPTPTPAAAPAPEPAVVPEPAKPAGRKPQFVVFVDEMQLLSWPDGDITIQTEGCTVDLNTQHFRALMTLVELRK